MRLLLTAFALVLSFSSLVHAQTTADASAQPQRYEAKEHYRFNLGGDSGQYTDWERLDLDGFDGLTTTILIPKAYGKAGDKWSSLARINLFGPGEGKDRPILSLIIEVDRKDNHADASIYRAKDKPREGFDAKLAVGKPFVVSIVRNAPGKLLVSIDKSNYEVPCEFDVKALSAVGSGVDVKFEPFNLLRRVER
jgi:hypothetical protein